jgi:hypothetical protein
MTKIASLFDDVLDLADLEVLPSDRPTEVVEGHDCDSCGVVTPDVDLWAMNTETGEQLWLCEACGY